MPPGAEFWEGGRKNGAPSLVREKIKNNSQAVYASSEAWYAAKLPERITKYRRLPTAVSSCARERRPSVNPFWIWAMTGGPPGISGGNGVGAVHHDVHVAPVGNHHTAETEFIAQDFRAQLRASTGKGAVDLVEGGHDISDRSFSQHDLERF